MDVKELGQFTFYFQPGKVLMAYQSQVIMFYTDEPKTRYAIGRFANDVRMLDAADFDTLFRLAREHGVPIRAVSRSSISALVVIK